MGLTAGGVVLSTDWEVDLGVAGKWAKATTARAFLEPLDDAGWLGLATHWWVDDAPPSPVGSVKELYTKASRWRSATAAIYAGSEDDPSWKVWLSMRRTELFAAVTFGHQHVTPSLREQLSALVAAWTKAMAMTPLALSVGALTPSGEYDRPFPHLESAYPLGAIDVYLGRRWHSADPERDAVLRAVEGADVGAGMRRSVTADLVHVALDGNLDDGASVASARSRSEHWLGPLVPTRLAPGWNARGDRLAIIVDRDELAPFTFFDTDAGVGYKAMVVDPETHAIDEVAWRALVAIARAGRAPDGIEVQAVRVVVPTREDALRLGPRAANDGLDRVVYPEGDAFWMADESRGR